MHTIILHLSTSIRSAPFTTCRNANEVFTSWHVKIRATFLCLTSTSRRKARLLLTPRREASQASNRTNLRLFLRLHPSNHVRAQPQQLFFLSKTVFLRRCLSQVVSTFDGGCSRGSRLGVLCRPPSGWQPNPEGSGGGYLFLVDSHAQEVARSMKLGGGSLGVCTSCSSSLAFIRLCRCASCFSSFEKVRKHE